MKWEGSRLNYQVMHRINKSEAICLCVRRGWKVIWCIEVFSAIDTTEQFVYIAAVRYSNACFFDYFWTRRVTSNAENFFHFKVPILFFAVDGRNKLGYSHRRNSVSSTLFAHATF